MNTFDDNLREAMQAGHEGASLDSAGNEGMARQVAATFHGRMRRWVILTWVATLFWVGVGVWAGLAFFRAQNTREWVLYASICLLAGLATAMLKMWNLMEINRNTHSREIKRLELQLALLAERLK